MGFNCVYVYICTYIRATNEKVPPQKNNTNKGTTKRSPVEPAEPYFFIPVELAKLNVFAPGAPAKLDVFVTDQNPGKKSDQTTSQTSVHKPGQKSGGGAGGGTFSSAAGYSRVVLSL